MSIGWQLDQHLVPVERYSKETRKVGSQIQGVSLVITQDRGIPAAAKPTRTALSSACPPRSESNSRKVMRRAQLRQESFRITGAMGHRYMVIPF